MNLNTDWKVLVLKDKRTYPNSKNRLIHFYLTDFNGSENHILGRVTDNGFVDINGKPIGFYVDKCFWNYVSPLPNCIKENKCKKCGKSEEEYWNNRCEFADDGYCLADFGSSKCKYIRYITEYWAYNK